MDNDQANEEKPELVVDEDWKERVKAENAALDQSLEAEAAEKKPETESKTAEPGSAQSAAPERKIDPKQLPPADFATIVGTFSTQAMLALGLVPNPATGKFESELPLARYFIDMLGVLEKKTAGNLEPHEATMLSDSVHELRLAYVEQSKSTGSTTAGEQS